MGVRRRHRLSLPGRDALVGRARRWRTLRREAVVGAAALVVIVAMSVLGLLGVPGAPRAQVTDDGDEPLALSFHQVALYPQAPQRRAVGKLLYRGGLVVRSEDPRFGGISGLLVTPDCRAFRAVSDHGWWVSGRLRYDAKGDLAGIEAARIQPLVGEKGRRLRSKTARDAESLALTPDGGVVVSFEGSNALRVYPPGGAPAQRLESPLHKGDGAGNVGIEALTTVADGGLLAISEDIDVSDGVKAWVGGNGKPWRTAVYHVDGGFRPTGAATLPDGDVVILERRVLTPAARLRRLRLEDIRHQAVLSGEELARFDGPLTYDNMEAVDVCIAANGEIRLLLASDDNYNWFQRTLFLMFALPK